MRGLAGSRWRGNRLPQSSRPRDAGARGLDELVVQGVEETLQGLLVRERIEASMALSSYGSGESLVGLGAPRSH
jgi:hypothetical protein